MNVLLFILLSHDKQICWNRGDYSIKGQCFGWATMDIVIQIRKRHLKTILVEPITQRFYFFIIAISCTDKSLSAQPPNIVFQILFSV